MSKVQIIAGAVTSVALLAAYVALTIAGHDASLLLGALIGQVGQGGLQAVAGATKAT